METALGQVQQGAVDAGLHGCGPPYRWLERRGGATSGPRREWFRSDPYRRSERPAAEGTGVIAGGAMRTVLELGGVRNILGKQLGSDNILNNAKATIIALTTLNEKIELGKYQSIRRQVFYDKVMKKYKNVRISN